MVLHFAAPRLFSLILNEKVYDSRMALSLFRIPWECTVCPFQSHNVYVMQKHMVDHTDDVLVRYHVSCRPLIA